MTSPTSLVNLALQSFGNKTTLTDAQLAAGSNNEAKQANLSFANVRDGLLRMAPWDCSLKTANLTYITSIPGTPENSSPATPLWQPGQPRPPWAYEYQYPVDCLRACWIIPATQTGFADTVPITTAVTGGAPTTWAAGPINFKVGIDEFYPVIAAAVAAGGSGYVVGDQITLPTGSFTNPPIGAPAILRVASIGVGGAVSTVTVVPQLNDSSPAAGGSYFAQQTNPVAQGSTTGVGVGATFNLTYGAKSAQRVILTNQEYATLVYSAQITDPNVWDPLFQDAFYNALGAAICMGLSGDKVLANKCIAMANNSLVKARAADGNEGLTVNDSTPDWIRTRGIVWADGSGSGPFSTFDWGGLLPAY